MTKNEKELIKKMIILIDSREQQPYKFAGSITKALPYGDYSVQYDGKDYTGDIIVERKGSVSELFALSGRGRDRFERELEKMRDVRYKYIIVEADLMDIVKNQPVGTRVEPMIVYSTLCSFAIKYQIPFLFCGNRVNGRGIMFKLFEFFVKYEVLKLGKE